MAIIKKNGNVEFSRNEILRPERVIGALAEIIEEDPELIVKDMHELVDSGALTQSRLDERHSDGVYYIKDEKLITYQNIISKLDGIKEYCQFADRDGSIVIDIDMKKVSQDKIMSLFDKLENSNFPEFCWAVGLINNIEMSKTRAVIKRCFMNFDHANNKCNIVVLFIKNEKGFSEKSSNNAIFSKKISYESSSFNIKSMVEFNSKYEGVCTIEILTYNSIFTHDRLTEFFIGIPPYIDKKAFMINNAGSIYANIIRPEIIKIVDECYYKFRGEDDSQFISDETFLSVDFQIDIDNINSDIKIIMISKPKILLTEDGRKFEIMSVDNKYGLYIGDGKNIMEDLYNVSMDEKMEKSIMGLATSSISTPFSQLIPLNSIYRNYIICDGKAVLLSFDSLLFIAGSLISIPNEELTTALLNPDEDLNKYDDIVVFLNAPSNVFNNIMNSKDIVCAKRYIRYNIQKVSGFNIKINDKDVGDSVLAYKLNLQSVSKYAFNKIEEDDGTIEIEIINIYGVFDIQIDQEVPTKYILESLFNSLDVSDDDKITVLELYKYENMVRYAFVSFNSVVYRINKKFDKTKDCITILNDTRPKINHKPSIEKDQEVSELLDELESDINQINNTTVQVLHEIKNVESKDNNDSESIEKSKNMNNFKKFLDQFFDKDK